MPHRLIALLAGLSLLLTSLHAGEWRARHDLRPIAGVIELGMPSTAAEVFLPGPDAPFLQSEWLAGLQGWRAERKERWRYDGSEYERETLSWTQDIYNKVQLLVWDRSFYDPEKQVYTVDSFLDQTEARLGKVDAALLWPAYPNLGIDDRNQFDLWRDLPGGLKGLSGAVDDFHQHGVKVFLVILEWDAGTRDEGESATAAGAHLINTIGADGISFDGLGMIPRTLYDDVASTGSELVLAPQFDLKGPSIAWSTLSWDDWVTWEDAIYPFVPMVSQVRWIEPRHRVLTTDRLTRNKVDSLQHAFFNGQGYVTIENIWGFWYPTSERDAEAILRTTRVLRTMDDALASPDWEPHAPTLQEGVFASKFPGSGITWWSLVNRNEYEVGGAQLDLPHLRGQRYFDAWHGTELQPTVHGDLATLDFQLEGLGFGAIAVIPEGAPSPELEALLAFMAKRTAKPLSAYSQKWETAAQVMTEIPPTPPAESAPPGMVLIEGGAYDFIVRGVEAEGGNDPGVNVQFPWETLPRRFHRSRMEVLSFYIDRTLVTNAEFAAFLKATDYTPMDAHNFLRHWRNGTMPAGWEQRPVTWVSIEDARAYAAWAGKRLPHSWEWQYAAQSGTQRPHPWGESWNAAAVPPVDHSRAQKPPSVVGAYPAGATPEGLLDMVGNVNQWTDEVTDPHTRAAIVRGGATYQPRGSLWYFPETYCLDEQQKYLLLSPGRDRSASIGFRCVVDAEPRTTTVP